MNSLHFCVSIKFTTNLQDKRTRICHFSRIENTHKLNQLKISGDDVSMVAALFVFGVWFASIASISSSSSSSSRLSESSVSSFPAVAQITHICHWGIPKYVIKSIYFTCKYLHRQCLDRVQRVELFQMVTNHLRLFELISAVKYANKCLCIEITDKMIAILEIIYPSNMFLFNFT